MSKSIPVLNGPNLNLLETRQPAGGMICDFGTYGCLMGIDALGNPLSA